MGNSIIGKMVVVMAVGVEGTGVGGAGRGERCCRAHREIPPYLVK